ncbi:glycosyltransferase family 4 protein [Methylobacterium sp. W2]|uniref:glycosyltransferase n=1 Tax=Methylobacterium sp. W2 TaxID=2598107 RepID=UPI001D0C9C1C|nr:glycosyltransferase [Methylobacterium sp. W2]MCC0808925.1 glycosyltransferase family 4 protein [Methylobacterium sp. W2]
MINVHLIPETPVLGPVWSCGEIRLLRPYGHESLSRVIHVTSGLTLPSGRIDVVVMQRKGLVEGGLASVSGVVREIKRRGARLIYDMDDDLLSRHPIPAVERMLAGAHSQIRFLLREADLITTSTEVLRDRLSLLNPNVFLWRNALDEKIIQPLTRMTSPNVVGYFGTASHLEDLMAVVSPIEAAASRHPGPTQIELCGVSDDRRIDQLFARRMTTRTLPTEPRYEKFHEMMAATQWRVGIAPLMSNPFNDAKSDIKILDYAAAGIPTVAMLHPVYASFQDGETALIVSREEFGSSVFRLLADEDLRQRIIRQSRDYLLQDRSLNVCAPLLRQFIDRVLS